MGTYGDQRHIPYAPTETAELYPDSDGQPMAVSDLHRRILTRTLEVLDTHFAERPEAYVSGDILMYYVEGDPRKSARADQEVAARQRAETELAELRAELERLKAQT